MKARTWRIVRKERVKDKIRSAHPHCKAAIIEIKSRAWESEKHNGERIRKGVERVSGGKERQDSRHEVSDKKVLVNKQKAGHSPQPINTSAYST